jgi:serine/threonine protein kinase
MPPLITNFTPSTVHRAPSLTPDSVAQIRLYRDRRIDAGSYASIYKVDVPLSSESADGSRIFAIKRGSFIYHDKRTHPIKRESDLLREINHPNIIKVYASWKSGDIWYMAMDCFDFNVSQLMYRHDALDVGSALYILGGLAKALAYMHERGIAHADVKYHNVLGKGDPSQPLKCSFVLADFNLARQSGERLPGEYGRIGPLNYLPQERLSGAAPPVIWHDIHATGCFVYNLLGGRLDTIRSPLMPERNIERITSFHHPDERIPPLLHNMVSESGSIQDGSDLVQYLKEFFPEAQLEHIGTVSR